MAKGAYAVGFKRPPRHTRFRSGQSGNPAGRPKGAANLATLLTKALEEKVAVTDKGRPRSLSKLEVMVKQLVNKAAGGDLRAFAQVQLLLERDVDQEPGERTKALQEEDQAVLQGLLHRMRQSVVAEVPVLPPEAAAENPEPIADIDPSAHPSSESSHEA